MRDKAPSFVIFDLDDTLYDYSKCNYMAEQAVFIKGSLETGVSVKEFQLTYHESRKTVKERLGDVGASHSRLLYLHETLSRIGFANQPALTLNLEQEFWRNYMMEMKLRHGVESLLSLLRSNRIPIGLVTDLTLQIQLRKLIKLGINAYFDVIVASEESSGDKVTLSPFHILVDRSNSEWLENVWFIGDKAHDCPIQELRNSGKIVNGLGWLKDFENSDIFIGWDEFLNIEKHLSRIISYSKE